MKYLICLHRIVCFPRLPFRHEFLTLVQHYLITYFVNFLTTPARARHVYLQALFQIISHILNLLKCVSYILINFLSL